jgi:hypothetical protein
MQDMARYGRNGDTMMAHVAPGEMVVPQDVLQENPEVAQGLGVAFRDSGMDPLRYTVGSGYNSINPATGEPEFFSIKDLFKKGLDVGKKFLGSSAGQAVTTQVLGDLLQGRKPSLRDALVSGAIGGGLGALSGDTSLAQAFGFGDIDEVAPSNIKGGRGNIFEKPGERKDYLESALKNQNKPDPISSGYKEGLLGIGEFFGLDPKDGIGRMLNTEVGEALAMGLGSKLMDAIFPPDDTPSAADLAAARANRSYSEIMADPDRIKLRTVRRPRGTAEQIERYFEENPNPNSNFIQLNKGGPTYFPRRDGGIMPSEGSGTKDDVPAMLTAGEFVMTRDAVKGAGNGDVNRGIQKMYGMMDKLEGMA